MTPDVSVIVPVYNVAPYLSECVMSVLRQTHQDFELLLVDDGSTDGSSVLCDAFALDDSRVRVHHQKNTGLSGARNVGLGFAKGEFVTFLDGDDWLDRHTLAVTLRAARRTQADVVLWPYVREYQGGVSIPKRLFGFNERTFSPEECRQLICRRMVGLMGEELSIPENADALVTACAKLYRRQVMEDHSVRFVDTALIGTEDAFFNLQVFTHVSSSVYLNQFMYHYRRDNTTSSTTRYRPDLQRQWGELHRLMRSHIAEHALGESFEQALRNRVAFSVIGLGLNALSAGLSRRAFIRQVDAILSDPDYRQAVKTLPLRPLPTPWRLFFTAAKYRQAGVVGAMLWTMNALRARRNRGNSH
ncbi:glycosyltransferase family 2 protein [Aestuariimicrobium sp. Y1814]|uniref:glycosyltransferase family 2 protein n=1 Tax=Aestuariimicrobium sp. Y1814 TaxID=3418742 RepID=UPI003DA70569